jgi:hypothetical protein
MNPSPKRELPVQLSPLVHLLGNSRKTGRLAPLFNLRSSSPLWRRENPRPFALLSNWISRIGVVLVTTSRDNYPAIYKERQAEVVKTAVSLLAVYNRNVFPAMKVTWGSYPNNIGHTDFPGCFRCHDDSHASRDGRKVTQDCGACHSLLATEEAAPKILADLGVVESKEPQ